MRRIQDLEVNTAELRFSSMSLNVLYTHVILFLYISYIRYVFAELACWWRITKSAIFHFTLPFDKCRYLQDLRLPPVWFLTIAQHVVATHHCIYRFHSKTQEIKNINRQKHHETVSCLNYTGSFTSFTVFTEQFQCHGLCSDCIRM